MAYSKTQIEKTAHYLWLNGVRISDKSNKALKLARNRKERRKIKSDINYFPEYKAYDGWEW